MSLTTILDAIKAEADKIESIKTAFAYPPVKLDSAQLPSLYVIPGPAVYRNWTETKIVIQRDYNLRVPVGTVTSSTPEARIREIDPIITDVLVHFSGLSHMGQTDIFEMRVLNDTGIRVLSDYGAKFIGFVITIQIEQMKGLNYASNE